MNNQVLETTPYHDEFETPGEAQYQHKLIMFDGSPKAPHRFEINETV